MTRKRNLTALLASLLADHGVRLVQTADGLTNETHGRLHDLADAIAALILASDFRSHIGLTGLIVQIQILPGQVTYFTFQGFTGYTFGMHAADDFDSTPTQTP